MVAVGILEIASQSRKVTEKCKVPTILWDEKLEKSGGLHRKNLGTNFFLQKIAWGGRKKLSNDHVIFRNVKNSIFDFLVSCQPSWIPTDLLGQSKYFQGCPKVQKCVKQSGYDNFFPMKYDFACWNHLKTYLERIFYLFFSFGQNSENDIDRNDLDAGSDQNHWVGNWEINLTASGPNAFCG